MTVPAQKELRISVHYEDVTNVPGVVYDPVNGLELIAPDGTRTPIGGTGITGGTLTSDIDANGHNITNIGALTATGLTGATGGQIRIAGATTGGAPVAGTFAAGDVTAAPEGLYVCITAGSPGTWIGPLMQSPAPMLFSVGDYYEVCGGQGNAGFFLVEAQEYATPFWVPSLMTFDRIGYWQNTNGAAGSVTRFGLRYFQPSNPGIPGAVLLDAGTVDTTSGAGGMKFATINQQLTPGYWWITICTQGGAASTVKGQVTNPGNGGTGPLIRAMGTTQAAGRYYVGPAMTGVTGALGNTFTMAARFLDSNAPYMVLRRSA